MNVGALVLFSGGKDSTVALADSLRRFSAVRALILQVPYRPRGEKLAAVAICQQLHVPMIDVSVPFLGDVASLRQIATGTTESAYVPMRNLVMHAIACSYAESWGVPVVVAGHIASDVSAYHDAAPSYLHAIYALASRGLTTSHTWPPERHRSISLSLPLAGLEDGEVISLGQRVGAPLEMSWSCLHDGEEACGACISCRDRNNAFVSAGLTIDPI